MKRGKKLKQINEDVERMECSTDLKVPFYTLNHSYAGSNK